MTKRKQLTTAAFAPELLAVLIKGTKERIELPTATEKLARHYVFRLNYLRAQMRKAKHAMAHVVEGAQIRRSTREDGTFIVIVEPADDDFAAAIRDAGVVIADELPLGMPLDPDVLPSDIPVSTNDVQEKIPSTTYIPPIETVPRLSDFFGMMAGDKKPEEPTEEGVEKEKS
jgi:hypothetical protein